MYMIEVSNLAKEFNVVTKKSGLKGSISSLLFPKKTLVKAVDDISFNISEGEMVGFLGPNGAGKSTTIKMLTGILQPSSGNIKICGLSPDKDRKKVVSNIGVVFGQRSQLYWDLRLGETFDLLKRIYQISDSDYKNNIKIMTEVLEIGDFIDTPVRQLSLGQRMRGEIAASMLHSPKILFLDEPTIGLDIESKNSLQKYIVEINKAFKTTVLLTTHDLDDIENLCKRIIVINKGKVVVDDDLGLIINKTVPYRILNIDTKTEITKDVSLSKNVEIINKEKYRMKIRFNNSVNITDLITSLIKDMEISNLSIEEPDIKDVIRDLYNIKK